MPWFASSNWPGACLLPHGHALGLGIGELPTAYSGTRFARQHRMGAVALADRNNRSPPCLELP